MSLDLAPPPELSDPLSAAVSARDRDTLKMVETALRQRKVRLAFQPVVQARASERPAFFEGLARVLDHTGRVIPAREFISVAETHEIGRLIDCAALELGLAALGEVPGLKLSVNMSARSIGYGPWREALERGLAAAPGLAQRLILEMTEASAMVMPDVVRAFMGEYQRKGVTFALDDFGAGQTSFRYLRDFYFDILKIDGAFSREIHADPDNQVLMQALLSVGRHFDMFTVAENVETARDAAFLTALGVDCLQGYHFGAPTLEPRWAGG